MKQFEEEKLCFFGPADGGLPGRVGEEAGLQPASKGAFFTPKSFAIASIYKEGGSKMDLPKIGLGTWQLQGKECEKVVKMALEMGYRHIDTAHVYQNHPEIAKGIGGFDRSKLFITSKISLEQQIDLADVEKSVIRACDLALKELKTDYLDLYLIHMPNRDFPLEAIFRHMEDLTRTGKVNKVGVSNYTIHHLQDLVDAGYKPFANQVEFHPYLYQKELLAYCQHHHIELIAFRPFGKGKLLKEEPLFAKIGERYRKGAGAVILKWLVQKGIPVIPKASRESHLKENLALFDFTLAEEEMRQIDSLGRSKRYCMEENLEYRY